MDCKRCGACCIALSISTNIPGTGRGKPAGERCVHLTLDNRCAIYPGRPPVCQGYSPSKELCGGSFEEAMRNLELLEARTR